MTSLPFIVHPLRQSLNDELHARPPVEVPGPAWITHLVFLHESGGATVPFVDEAAHLQALPSRVAGGVAPLVEGSHWILDAGDLRLKWERHNEFSSYTFFRRRLPGDGAKVTALEAFPGDWVASIPGTLAVATHLDFCSTADCDPAALLKSLETSPVTQVVTWVAEGAALVVSDFLVHEGFNRLTVVDLKLKPRQSARTIQRLLEIETYRSMALLAFPVAKEVSSLLARCEKATADLMTRMTEELTHEDEYAILSALTQLAAELELSVARTTFRFGAAQAYSSLVEQRVHDLEATSVPGFPSIGGFLRRRLSPAMQTCLSVAQRQTDLSERVARKSSLLRTRVDIELERQNRELLSQLNRRSSLQLRLQETVEGLSIVAITYYGSSLVREVAEGVAHRVAGVDAVLIGALSVPVIAVLVAFGIRRMRRHLMAE
jgi:uncharacterized membrane-anchored protein